jgi:YggT family protein
MLFKLLDIVLDLYSIVLIASAIMSWVKINEEHPTKKFVEKLVEPVLKPVRKVIPPINGFDLSVIAVLLLIQIIQVGLLRST